MIELADGKAAVEYARACVEAEVLGGPAPEPPQGEMFSTPSGVFVTLNTHPRRDLRGCIGYPYPFMPLAEAIAGSAASACHDPRFPDLAEGELGKVTVEVTVLTPPEPLTASSPGEMAESVKIGRDGLVIELAGRRGLLLPQVPVEWGWDAEEFLMHLSMKAGLPPDAWRHPAARISSFTGEIFKEAAPRGGIVRETIS